MPPPTSPYATLQYLHRLLLLLVPRLGVAVMGMGGGLFESMPCSTEVPPFPVMLLVMLLLAVVVWWCTTVAQW